MWQRFRYWLAQWWEGVKWRLEHDPAYTDDFDEADSPFESPPDFY